LVYGNPLIDKSASAVVLIRIASSAAYQKHCIANLVRMLACLFQAIVFSATSPR